MGMGTIRTKVSSFHSELRAFLSLSFCSPNPTYDISIKIRFKAIHHLQYRENMHFLLPPLILRLHTGCRLDQILSKCIASLKRQSAKMLWIGVLFISQTLPKSFCACVLNTPKIVTFVIGKMKLVPFSLFLEAFAP